MWYLYTFFSTLNVTVGHIIKGMIVPSSRDQNKENSPSCEDLTTVSDRLRE